MSQANVEKLKEVLANDTELQRRLASAQGESALVTTLIGIGKEKGISITEADLEEAKAQPPVHQELSDEQLKTVAAGGVSYGSSWFCGFCGNSGSFYLPR